MISPMEALADLERPRDASPSCPSTSISVAGSLHAVASTRHRSRTPSPYRPVPSTRSSGKEHTENRTGREHCEGLKGWNGIACLTQQDLAACLYILLLDRTRANIALQPYHTTLEAERVAYTSCEPNDHLDHADRPLYWQRKKGSQEGGRRGDYSHVRTPALGCCCHNMTWPFMIDMLRAMLSPRIFEG